MKKGEIWQFIFASLIIGFIFSFRNWGFENFSVSEGLGNWLGFTIVSLIALLVHYLGITLFAKKYKVSAEYKIWTTSKKAIVDFSFFLKPLLKPTLPKKVYSGVIVPLIFSFFSNGLFKVPLVGVTEIKEDPSKLLKLKHKYLSEYKQAIIYLAGPMFNLLLALILTSINKESFSNLIQVNYYLAIFTMLPIGSFNGTKVLFGSRLLYLFSAAVIILCIAFIHSFSFIASILLSLLLALVLAIYLLWTDKE